MKYLLRYLHILLLSIGVSYLFVGCTIPSSSNATECLEIKDEWQYFSDSAGFPMPTNAQIIISCDNHGGFHGDGEYYIVFSTTAKNIEDYQRESIWNLQWIKGSVPSEISYRTVLSNKFKDILESSEISYIVENRNTQIPLHNGRLIVIYPKENKVLYSKWDY